MTFSQETKELFEPFGPLSVYEKGISAETGAEKYGTQTRSIRYKLKQAHLRTPFGKIGIIVGFLGMFSPLLPYDPLAFLGPIAKPFAMAAIMCSGGILEVYKGRLEK